MRGRGLLVSLALYVGLIAGCGGGSGSSESALGNDGQTLEEVLAQPLGEETECPGLGFSRQSGVPGDPITLTGLPPEMGEVGLRVIAETPNGETLVAPLFVQIDEDTGETTFGAPSHPGGDPEGGVVHLEVGDGDLHCPPKTFTVEALPEAPEDYPVTVAKELERWADRALQQMGYDPQVLLEADPDDLPEARRGVWFVKQYISSDREDALPALAQQAAANGDEFLARLLKASGVEQAVDQAIAEMNAVTEGRLETRALQSSERLVQRDDAGIAQTFTDDPLTQSLPSLSPSAKCDAQAFEPDQLQVGSAAELSARMKAAREGHLFDGSATGQTLGAASLLDGGNIGDAAGYLGAGVFTISTVEAAKQALEPQRITDFEIERVEQKWVEDRPWDEPLFWDGANVRAEGGEFNLSEATLQSLVTALGMAPGPVGTATTAATTVSPDGINDVIADLTEESCVRIKAPKYGPVRVDQEPGKWTEVDTGATIALVSEPWSKEYIGVDIGASALAISLKAEPFLLDAPLREEFLVDVVPVNTSLIPSSVTVPNPGVTVDLAATATNSYQNRHQTDYTPSLPEGKGSLVAPGVVGDRYEVDYETPVNRADYPTFVKWTAHHPVLPRGSGPRTYQVSVTLGGELAISPRNVCMDVGDSQSFSAALGGFAEDNESVSWSASAGSISSTGDLTASYQAPNSPTTVDITATADADSDVSDTVTITVSENCLRKAWWPTAGINLDGSGTYNYGCAIPGDHDDVQEKSLVPEDVPAPEDMLDPGEYWYDRNEGISADFIHESDRHIYDDDLEQCFSIALSGSNDSSIEYTAQGDGTLAASLDSEVVTDCASYGISGDTECTAGGSFMSLHGGAFFLNLEGQRNYQLEGELSCSGLEGEVLIGWLGGALGLSATVVRFEDGEVLQSSGVENPDGSWRSPVLFDETCTESDQTVSIEEDFVLAAPPEGKVHDILIHLGGVIQVMPNYDGQDNLGQIDTSIPELPEPVVGSHTSKADIDFSVRLSPN